MGVEYDSIRAFSRALGRVPKELRAELRPRLRAGGQHILTDMKARASYSKRIPSATRMTVSFSTKGGGVRFRVASRQAPHARVLERGNLSGRAEAFRHPIFGTDTWVTQQTRPFFFPALISGRRQLHEQIGQALRASQRKAIAG